MEFIGGRPVVLFQRSKYYVSGGGDESEPHFPDRRSSTHNDDSEPAKPDIPTSVDIQDESSVKSSLIA